MKWLIVINSDCFAIQLKEIFSLYNVIKKHVYEENHLVLQGWLFGIHIYKYLFSDYAVRYCL